MIVNTWDLFENNIFIHHFYYTHVKLTCLLIVVSYQAAKVGIQLRLEGQGKMEKTILHFFDHPRYELHGKCKSVYS